MIPAGARRLVPALLALWLCGGSAAGGIGYLVRIELAAGVTAADFAAFPRAVVVPFAEQASRHASWHDRKERRDAARRAAQDFPRRLLLALRTTQVFYEVKDVPRPGEPALLVTGVLRRHERGSADARMHFGSGKSGAVFEATLQLSDGATGRVLGVVRIEREPSVSGPNTATPRSVEHLMEAAAADCANAIARLVAA